MRTSEIIREIQRLPVQKRRKQEDANLLKKAADILLDDYRSDTELTVTNIDFEDFYEAK